MAIVFGLSMSQVSGIPKGSTMYADYARRMVIGGISYQMFIKGEPHSRVPRNQVLKLQRMIEEENLIDFEIRRQWWTASVPVCSYCKARECSVDFDCDAPYGYYVSVCANEQCREARNS